MKTAAIALLGSILLSGTVYAQEAAAPSSDDCSAKAVDKKLAGAAKNSFIKKCERDAAQGSCDASAAEKKLHGAAKNSFVKKCVKDATAH
ncbi:MAG: hypothetical protein ACR652_26090 [Methylocystis sp.]|uniref:hypothetical protein n=1 Tax=Methylocystis sp. TaxID=1911079 RepID=UPI003DA2E787